jgi:hypothetical protein
VSNSEGADVLQGTLDIMILQTLARSAVVVQVCGRGPHRADLERPRAAQYETLYPGLMRLEQRSFISVTWA